MSDNNAPPATTTAHTPGPWKAVQAITKLGPIPGVWNIRDTANDWDLADVAGCTGYDEDEGTDTFLPEDESAANARLIAAAPELLAALKAARSELFGVHMVNETLAGRELPEGDVLPQIRAAIAKAEGGAQ